MHQNVNITLAAVFYSKSWRSYLSGRCPRSFEMGIIDHPLYMRHDGDINNDMKRSNTCFGFPHGGTLKT